MKWISGVFLSMLFFSPFVAYGANFSVTPVVIDGKGKVREIMRYTVTLKNTTDRMISLYPWVADLDPELGSSAKGDLDGSREKELRASLARWIEITRGVINLHPGESREIPVLIQINLNAEPGVYHAVIHFSDGPNRKEAEANTRETVDTLVNVEVLDDAHIRLQLGAFSTDKNYFLGSEASFSYHVENIGNRSITPGGKVRIFNRQGEEVAALDANMQNINIEPNGKTNFAAVWAANGEFGKYKAMLDLEYGNHDTIQDTVFFWVLPWGKMLSYFFFLSILSVVVGLLFHARTVSRRPAYAAERAIRGETISPDPAHEFSATPMLFGRMNKMIKKDAIEPNKSIASDIVEKETIEMPERKKSPDHRVVLSAQKAKVDPRHIIDLGGNARANRKK